DGRGQDQERGTPGGGRLQCRGRPPPGRLCRHHERVRRLGGGADRGRRAQRPAAARAGGAVRRGAAGGGDAQAEPDHHQGDGDRAAAGAVHRVRRAAGTGRAARGGPRARPAPHPRRAADLPVLPGAVDRHGDGRRPGVRAAADPPDRRHVRHGGDQRRPAERVRLPAAPGRGPV
ncbi:MAG: hypothetical protein AVDCRST_MAG41-3016, partial [uncultured Corynebacteriales bacterium]